jgi:hypothetical protein
MRAAVALLVLISTASGQAGAPPTETAAHGLRLQVRTSSTHLRMTDEVVLTVLFRSPENDITIWNALGWGPDGGLHLQVSDAAGREVRNDFVEMYHALPPDRAGRNALMTIGGDIFAGLDSLIPAATLFPKPGRYTVKCFYHPSLPRDYFHGHTIWGKEDDPIESASVAIFVDK